MTYILVVLFPMHILYFCFHQRTSHCEVLDCSVLPRNQELIETYFSSACILYS
jgi:hypothetical protein